MIEIIATAMYEAGPTPVESWTSKNPPTDVRGPPEVYRLVLGPHEVLIDRWLVELCVEDGGVTKAIKYMASEIAVSCPS